VISNFPDFTQEIPYNDTFNPHITMEGGGMKRNQNPGNGHTIEKKKEKKPTRTIRKFTKKPLKKN